MVCKINTTKNVKFPFHKIKLNHAHVFFFNFKIDNHIIVFTSLFYFRRGIFYKKIFNFLCFKTSIF